MGVQNRCPRSEKGRRPVSRLIDKGRERTHLGKSNDVVCPPPPLFFPQSHLHIFILASPFATHSRSPYQCPARVHPSSWARLDHLSASSSEVWSSSGSMFVQPLLASHQWIMSFASVLLQPAAWILGQLKQRSWMYFLHRSKSTLARGIAND